MSATKRISTGDYTISTLPAEGNPTGNVIVNTNTFRINGNIYVSGNTFANLDTIQPVINLNANLSPTNSPYSGSSGINVIRGTQPTTSFYWNETGTFAGQWTLTDASGAQGPIVTSFNAKIAETTNTPSYNPGYVTITGFTSKLGKSGLYVNSGNKIGELATAAAALKYSIIFG